MDLVKSDNPEDAHKELLAIIKTYETEKATHLNQIKSLKDQLSLYKKKNQVLKKSIANLDVENNRLVSQMDQYQLANINYLQGLEVNIHVIMSIYTGV